MGARNSGPTLLGWMKKPSSVSNHGAGRWGVGGPIRAATLQQLKMPRSEHPVATGRGWCGRRPERTWQKESTPDTAHVGDNSNQSRQEEKRTMLALRQHLLSRDICAINLGPFRDWFLTTKGLSMRRDWTGRAGVRKVGFQALPNQPSRTRSGLVLTNMVHTRIKTLASDTLVR
jgi:hypothetical protein